MRMFDTAFSTATAVVAVNLAEATRKLPWTSCDHRAFVKVDGQELILDHYAGRTWNKSHHGSVQLFGHSHNQMPGNSQQLEVGVDAWGFMRVSWPEIQQRLAALPPFWTPPEVTDEASEDDGYGR